MKFAATLFVLLITVAVQAQNITGPWYGLLNVSGTPLRLSFTITKTDTGYSATMDSPDQGATGLPVKQVRFEAPSLQLDLPNFGITYPGDLKNNEITGIFKQGGREIPLNLSREKIEKPTVKRSQEPKTPYPYYTEDVSFNNKNANLTLAGTLSLPKKEGVFPAVVLITGSGAQNRDEELMGHKPFLIIADYLTRNGIAVLRYDDRGIGKSTGDFLKATTADLATDVEAAVAYLKTRHEIKKEKIGLIGHSEGGLIAPIVAARSKDVAFIVLLAGTGIRGDSLLLLQSALIAKAEGRRASEIDSLTQLNAQIFKEISSTTNDADLSQRLTTLLNAQIDSTQVPAGITKAQFIATHVSDLVMPWMQYFITLDPTAALKKVKCPVLALNGSKDLQVPPAENLPAIKAALTSGGNKNVTIKELPNLNHLFQESTTGSPGEYATIEQTFSPVALDVILKWIQTQTK